MSAETTLNEPTTDAAPSPLPPAEAARARTLKGAAGALRLGAMLNALLASVLAVIAVFGGLSGSDVFSPLADLLLSGYDGAADAASLLLILLALGHLSGLLVLMVGASAQEFWAPAAALLYILVSALLLVFWGHLPALIGIAAAGWAGVYMARDARAFRFNPLMLKELRERMRGARAFVVITVYLALMSGFTVLIYLIETNAGPRTTSVTGELGRNLFRGIVALELLLIVFIAPAFTSGAIANERERKTYDLLHITLLPHPSFVFGKLESALGYILLLLLAAVPLQSIAFLFGGVSEQELLLAFILLSVTGMALGTLGLYFSTLVDRTLTASVRAYTVAFAVMVGVPVALTFGLDVLEELTDQGLDTPATLQAFFLYADSFLTSLNPITSALETQDLLVNNQGAGFYTERLRDGTTIPLASPWITFTFIYLTAAALLIVLSVRALRRSDDAGLGG